eukprot:Nitzschia sp. Nitz4//scaffold24_size164493//119801//121450//NITZ4_002342-RA/size164493-processed-gene-0.82-mRNA-1//1//CDS//3329544156//6885//frame0
MPRVSSATMSQPHGMGFTSDSSPALFGSSNGGGNASSTILSPNKSFEPSPSSANSVPRLRTPAVPAPQSFKVSSSLSHRSPMVAPNRLSPVRYDALKELPTLPYHNPPPTSSASAGNLAHDLAPRKPARNILRAAENGTGSVLPDYNHQPAPSSNMSGIRNREPPNRFKTRSSPSLKQIMNIGGVLKSKQKHMQQQLPQTQHDLAPSSSKQSLRRRTYSTNQSDDEDGSSNRRRDRSRDSPYRSSRNHRTGSSWFSGWHKLNRIKLGHVLQVTIVLAVTALVWESHRKAMYAVELLGQYKEEESLMLLHLQKIEQQSIQLHENLGRLAQSDIHEGSGGNKKDAGDVDFDLINQQIKKLNQMEQALNDEAKPLQTRIQQSARNYIVASFGEGPVQVVLELDFGGEPGPDTISILLWRDTPHAAWTLLDQISRHIWDGARFDWKQGHLIDAVPQHEDPAGGKVLFVEHSKNSHDAWTVGLHETDEGGLSMYVNLQNNTNIHKHETCVGKVTDGFDAFERLLKVSKGQLGGGNPSTVTIKQARAMHVTKKQH